MRTPPALSETPVLVMAALRWILLLVFATTIAVALFLQHETSANLRGEIVLLREDVHELERLRGEQARLLAAQPPAAELTRLQTDRAALNRLRAEIERMKEHAEQTAHRLSAPMGNPAPSGPAAALTLPVVITGDGALSMGDRPLDWVEVRQVLSRLAKGDAFEVRVSMSPDARAERIEAIMDTFKTLTKELGLRMSLLLEPQQPSR